MNKKRRILLLVFATLALAVFAVNAGRILVIDDPKPSDVVVVLAGETDVRPAKALQLLKQGYGSRILLDVPATARIYEFSQIDLAKRYIRDLPTNLSVDICPIIGLSTRDEARDVRECIENQQVHRILIVTSDFHTRRALSAFRHQLPDKIFSVAAAHDDAEFGVRWWTRRQWAKTCVAEWMRSLWWNSVDRWR